MKRTYASDPHSNLPLCLRLCTQKHREEDRANTFGDSRPSFKQISAYKVSLLPLRFLYPRWHVLHRQLLHLAFFLAASAVKRRGRTVNTHTPSAFGPLRSLGVIRNGS